MDPLILFFALVNGLLVGCLYGGVALGLSLIFGVLRVINFAHGSFLMLAMYASYYLWDRFGMHPYLSGVVVAPALFLIGYAVQARVIAPLFNRERAMVVEPLSALLVTAGVYLVIDNLVLMYFGPDVRTVSVDIAGESLFLMGLPVSLPRLIAALSAIAIALALSFWLRHSDLGRSVRATAQNRDAAALSGINVRNIYNVTFGLGCAIVGLFGTLMIVFLPVKPTTGLAFGIKSFLVVVLGGIGSISGSLVGGIVLGIFESIASQFVTATSAAMFSFGLFIAVLLFRPSGIMGAKLSKR
ncbi:branched-chain amino acid ABC transporter permease [Kerstersia similis]|uniref:branched-chain amino acid ABC transporter permease n=1 Tax=Kerstersia similis TaxID=206505 RepID=UPI0039EF8C7A